MVKRIGLVPPSFINDPEKSCMDDYCRVGYNYIKRTVEAGCTPIGLAPAGGWISEDALELCDGFIVLGGDQFRPYHFQVIHHAITHNKKYLGICLGQQLIYVYFELKRRVEEQGYEDDLVKAIANYHAHILTGSVQERIPNHRAVFPARGQEDAAKHDVDIVPGTLLHRVLGRDKMRIASFHDFNTPSKQTLVPINAWSAMGDGVVEGTEYGENILGVQGHPEIDELLPELFAFLATD